MSSNIPFEEIKGYDYLPPEDRSWIYDNAKDEPAPEIVLSRGPAWLLDGGDDHLEPISGRNSIER